jgi:hypothetical protein
MFIMLLENAVTENGEHLKRLFSHHEPEINALAVFARRDAYIKESGIDTLAVKDP